MAAFAAPGRVALAAVALLLMPLAVLVLASVAYMAGVVASLASFDTIAESLINWYRRSLEFLFAPPVLPTIVPRAVLLAVLVDGVLFVAALRARRGERWTARQRRALVAPARPAAGSRRTGRRVQGRAVADHEGASTPHADAGERYVELLMENFGQPGFREVMLAVHDLDARRT